MLKPSLKAWTASFLLLGGAGAICAAGDELEGWVLEDTPNPAPSVNALLDVHAVSTEDVWAVGYQLLGGTRALALHWDGVAWTQSPLPDVTGLHALNGVGGAGADDTWAVGWSFHEDIRSTLIMHWNGSEWSIVPSPNTDPVRNELRAVAALSPTDAWAVGYHGVWDAGGESPLVIHWNGEAWEVVPTPADPEDHVEGLSGVFALAADDIWAVGDIGYPAIYEFRALHYDGRTWEDVDVPQSGEYGRHLEGVVALSPTNIWFAGFANFGGDVGEQGVILHYDGKDWVQTVPFCQYLCSLWDIAAGGPDDILATGHREVGAPDFPQAYRSDGVVGAPWTHLDLEDLDGFGTGVTRGCAVLPSGEAWSVGWRHPGDGQMHTRVYHYIPPRPPPVPGDLDGDGSVGFNDLLILLAAWGECPAPPAECAADLDDSGDVGFGDLLILLASWTA